MEKSLSSGQQRRIVHKRNAARQPAGFERPDPRCCLTPNNDGKVVRINIPPLTEERRKDLGKLCKKLGEDSKVVVRNLRRDANEELKGHQKSGSLSEDGLRKSQDEIQKLTDEFIKKIDEVIKNKENEILEKT